MSYSKIPAGKDLPNDIYVAIEIPANHAPIKYEIDHDSDCLMVDRFMATPMFYPANYGFIPRTYCPDHDPLDVLVLMQEPVVPFSFLRCKPIGVMQMVDSGDMDDKIIAIANTDPSVNYINNVEEMPAHFFNELRHFFEEYKKLENKTVIVEEFQDKATALDIITDALKLYADTYKR